MDIYELATLIKEGVIQTWVGANLHVNVNDHINK